MDLRKFMYSERHIVVLINNDSAEYVGSILSRHKRKHKAEAAKRTFSRKYPGKPIKVVFAKTDRDKGEMLPISALLIPEKQNQKLMREYANKIKGGSGSMKKEASKPKPKPESVLASPSEQQMLPDPWGAPRMPVAPPVPEPMPEPTKATLFVPGALFLELCDAVVRQPAVRRRIEGLAQFAVDLGIEIQTVLMENPEE